ncbi:MAG TPA: hypothetical protein VFK02_25790 [Kofleriaceae bacterium]|nr:hypothetical protein [Kofleriaceae bacterium]
MSRERPRRFQCLFQDLPAGTRPARRRRARARIDQLAHRVRWLDRYRRMLAVAAAAVISPILIARLAAQLGAEWPQMHVTMLTGMLGVIVWWIVEVGLVYVTALWETEYYRLANDRGLPRAIVHKTRR